MAAGITLKACTGLFEDEVEFDGKYANMVRFLRDEVGVFGSYRDAYVVASIVGFLNNR